MNEPTTNTPWGGEKTRQTFDAPALVLTAAAGCIFSTSQFNPYDAFLLFISFLLIALTADALLQRCANIPTDETAWHELFGRFQQSVDATIYHQIKGRYSHLYSDAIQSFYQRLLEKDRRALHAFRGKTDTEARVYLCRIAACIAIDVIKKEQRELPPYVSLEAQSENGTGRKEFADTTVVNEDYLVLRDSIDACLEKIIDGKNRERKILIFQLMTYDGWSAKQIADLPQFAGMRPHTIDVLVSRIRAEVGHCLEKK